MNPETRSTPVPNDDIDLVVLMEKSVSFLKRFALVFVAAGILGIAAGIFMYKWLPKVYTSKMVLHSFMLTNPEQMQIVANWSALLANDEYASLARKLNCDEAILHPIKRIRAEEIQKVFTTENPNGFTIEVTLTDNSILEPLQEGILYGLRNSEYVNARMISRRSTLSEMIVKTTSELRKLDSTKLFLDRIMRGESRSAPSMILEAGTINRQWLEMNERLLNYQSELKFAEAVQVLQGFSRFDRPTGPKLIPWLIIGLVFFLGLAWIYAVLRTLRHRMALRARLHPVN